jgi:hypothetical protein
LGAQAGFPERTVERARQRLGVLHRSIGYGTSKRSWWSLPSFLPSEPISASLSDVAELAELGESGRNGGDEGLSEEAVEREAIRSEEAP